MSTLPGIFRGPPTSIQVRGFTTSPAWVTRISSSPSIRRPGHSCGPTASAEAATTRPRPLRWRTTGVFSSRGSSRARLILTPWTPTRMIVIFSPVWPHPSSKAGTSSSLDSTRPATSSGPAGSLGTQERRVKALPWRPTAAASTPRAGSGARWISTPATIPSILAPGPASSFPSSTRQATSAGRAKWV